MASALLLTLLVSLRSLASARDIIFPRAFGTADATQYQLLNDEDEVGSAATLERAYAGLLTFANLPYVHCLAPRGQEVEKYDIAFLGAPFDTVSSVVVRFVPCQISMLRWRCREIELLQLGSTPNMGMEPVWTNQGCVSQA